MCKYNYLNIFIDKLEYKALSFCQPAPDPPPLGGGGGEVLVSLFLYNTI